MQNVHLSGGSLLGVSRGGPSVSDIVDSMEVLNQPSISVFLHKLLILKRPVMFGV